MAIVTGKFILWGEWEVKLSIYLHGAKTRCNWDGTGGL